jgi:integrase/recombinase XerD
MYSHVKNVSFNDGAFTGFCLEFIKYKHSLGQKFEGSDIYRLREICNQLNRDSAIPFLTKELACKIALRKRCESQGTHINRIKILRQLAEFMISVGVEAYIYPKHYTSKYRYDFMPYIFSSEQINLIIKAADEMRYSPHSPLAHLVFPAMIRVFFGCGLRSSEARELKTCNIDLNNGILTIVKSKNNVTRYVPIFASLTGDLRRYANTINITSDNGIYFFPSPDGGFYSETVLRHRCHQLFVKANIPLMSNGKYPRVHDMRHSFVVHSYANLTGKYHLDLYTAMPIIATYVGHTNIKDTERYIHLPEFDYDNLISAGRSVIASSIPEVTFDA